MLELCLTTSLEVLNAAVRGKTGRVPEAHWCLHTKLVLERTQRRGSVVGPVTPGASSQTILCGNDLLPLFCQVNMFSGVHI